MAPKSKLTRRIPTSLMLKSAILLVLGVTVTLSAALAMWQQKRERQVNGPGKITQGQPQGTPARNDNTRGTEQTPSPEKPSAKNAPLRAPFYAALDKALASRGWKLQEVCSLEDPVAKRVMEDYGAMFLAKETVKPPPVCVFRDEGEVIKFQNEAKFRAENIGGATIDLQPAAMNALLDARESARKERLDITPRGGREAARRSYQDTLRLWNTRFLPALTYWTRRGRLSQKEAARLRGLPVPDQVREVLELEKRGIFFSQDLSKSILYSIAAPGTSQHMAMLALDVAQFGDPRVRRILAAHGWFQTVKSDLPHFTYLGLAEKDLPAAGLTSVTVNSQVFWIPNVKPDLPR